MSSVLAWFAVPTWNLLGTELTLPIQFQQWIQTHGKLHGPHDFHSLQHYLSLYVLARKLEIEGLQNQSGSFENLTTTDLHD